MYVNLFKPYLRSLLDDDHVHRPLLHQRLAHDDADVDADAGGLGGVLGIGRCGSCDVD